MSVTFLTGASSGLGAALAPLLAADGHAIALIARRAAPLEALAQKLRDDGFEALAIPCDVSDRAAVHQAIAQCNEAFGPITRLVANAGISRHEHATDFDASLLSETIQINLMGVAYAIEAILPMMLVQQRGHIVGVSSMAAYRGLPGSAAYCASKAGLTALLEGLRIELTPKGVDVTVIHPGFVKTPMTEKNSFKMPFLLSLEEGARKMHEGILSRRPIVNFPLPLSIAVQVSRLLPSKIYDKVLKGKGQ